MSDLNSDKKLIDALERQAQPLKGLDNDYDSIIQAVQGNTSVNDKAKIVVLIGEATYGTADFYRTRSEITQRLITEQGFDAIAIEADWPDASRINRYVSGESNDIEADAALSDFERFPAWIWRNIEVQAFIQWLHHYNQMHRKDRGPRTQTKNVGFYGLDFYNMTASIGELLSYLDKTNPKEAEAARARYASFSEFISDRKACYSTIGSHGRNSPSRKQLPSSSRQVINQLYCAMEDVPDSERDGAFAGEEYF